MTLQTKNQYLTLAKLIKLERQRLGLSQEQLGKIIGLNAYKVSKFEKNIGLTPEIAQFILMKMGSDIRINHTYKIQNFEDGAFLISVISNFATYKNIPLSKSYIYLKTFKGLEFLTKYIDIEKTLSLEEVNQDLSKVCFNNGGRL